MKKAVVLMLLVLLLSACADTERNTENSDGAPTLTEIGAQATDTSPSFDAAAYADENGCSFWCRDSLNPTKYLFLDETGITLLSAVGEMTKTETVPYRSVSGFGSTDLVSFVVLTIRENGGSEHTINIFPSDFAEIEKRLGGVITE